MLCRVAAVKKVSLYIIIVQVIFDLLWDFENRIPLKPALVDECGLCVCVWGGGGGGGRRGGERLQPRKLQCCICEEIQSNRVSDCRDFVCSLFQKAILYDFYSTSLAPSCLVVVVQTECADWVCWQQFAPHIVFVCPSFALRKQAYSNILKILPPKNENFQIKILIFSHISAQNIYCGYSLEPPRRGGSNEYLQSVFEQK